MTKLIMPAMIAGFITLGLVSCSKDDKKTDPVITNSLQGMFQAMAETPQSFTVTAGTYQTIHGARGTIIRFNPQSFKDGSGNIINSGTVNIKLTEAYTPGQMILNGVTTTTAAHKLLTSGGSVNIVATINQHEVFANNYSLSFAQPAPIDNSPMALFKGQTTDLLPGARTIWGDDTTNTIQRTTKDSMYEGNFYAFDTCINFNWINCDYFYSAPDPKTDVKVVMPDASYTAANTQVFVVFPGINAVTSLFSYDATTHTFSLGYAGYYLPVGTNIKIMVLSGKENNAYYMDKQENITVTNGISITANPTSSTLSTIQTTLSSL